MQKIIERKHKRSRRERAARFVKWFWGLFLGAVGFMLLMLLLTAAGAFGKLPSFEELENPKNNLATELYSEDGKLVGAFYIQNRIYVDYDELSPALIEALIATEDVRFNSHSGIDFIALARVGIKTIALGRNQGGGSTITQQLAKNLFPRDDMADDSKIKRMAKLFITKFKEWITAVKLEYNYTKEEIITMYLNTVPYGSNAFGIKAAANTFYNKEPADLDVTEAATLVGVVNAPTRYSPVRNPERSIQRRNTVMSRMRRNGFLSRGEYDSLSLVPLDLDFKPSSHDQGVGTYFREMVRMVMNAQKPQRGDYPNTDAGRWDYEQELLRWENNPIWGWCHKNTKSDGTPYDIYRDGLKIYTTLNYNMQQYAEQAVDSVLGSDIQPKLDRQWKNSGRLFIDTNERDINRIIANAMRYTDRYRNLKKEGASDAEIEREFNTPTEMKIFSFNGEIDTLMTPRDSIIYHKSIMRASFVAMDPETGHVKAYVGGPDFKYFKYDMARQGKRHIGSTIKPFVYTFAIDGMGLTPCTMVPNLPTTIETYNGEAWTPKEASGGDTNYDGVEHPLKWGLARSRNNYSAWIMKEAKQPRMVADFINQMGIHSYIDPVDALALGTADVSLMEMVGAYGSFANQGVFTEPIFITRIEDRQGNLIASFTPATSESMSKQTAYTMLQMLEDVVIQGTAGRLRWRYGFTDMEIGGKTGTSQENRDAWFIGVVPRLVAGVWIGGEDQSVHLRTGGEGAALALPIYAQFLQDVLANRSLGVSRSDRFLRPDGAVDYTCRETSSEENFLLPEEDEFFD